MKKKKKRMYKASAVFVIVLGSILVSPVFFRKFIDTKKPTISDEKKLKDIGYSLNDIDILKDNKNALKYAISSKYDKNLIDYLEFDNFDINNLSKYYKYFKNNKDASYEDVIKLVNYSIFEEYSELLMNIVNDKYFIRSNLSRYLDYKGDNSRSIVEAVNCNIDNVFYTKLKASDVSSNELVLVNKYYYLNKDFIGFDLVDIDANYGYGKLSKVAYSAFLEMRSDAAKLGFNLYAKSNYRSFDYQSTLYNGYKVSNGLMWADKYSARPGHSEHQTGLVVDITAGYSNIDTFIYTSEYKWLVDNANKYGFILRFPEGKSHLTGYEFEPWHFRYVGKNAAKVIKNENLLFEEYHEFYVKNKGV